MMDYQKQNTRSISDRSKIQETFLNHCRKERLQVIISCQDQTYEGRIAGFDSETIVLESQGNQQLFYKTAIARVHALSEINIIYNDARQYRNYAHSYELMANDYH